MKAINKKHFFSIMTKKLNNYNPSNWNDISNILTDIKENAPSLKQLNRKEFLKRVRKGLAFLLLILVLMVFLSKFPSMPNAYMIFCLEKKSQ